MKTQKMVALVLDDQPNWRDLLAYLLEEENFEVTLAASLAEAVSKLNAQRFDLVVTDLRLVDADPANEDGLRLAEKLCEPGSHTNVIVVTGYPTFKSARSALGKIKVYDYLEKSPSGGDFDDRQFINLARQAAEKSRRALENRASQLVLLVEPIKTRRKRIVGILSEDGHPVDSAASPQEAQKILKESERRYGLVLLNDALLQTHPELLASLQEAQPQARFIILSSHSYAEHIHGLFKKDVFDVIPVSEDGVDIQQVRISIRHALAPETCHYVSLQFIKDEQAKEAVTAFQVGQSYQLRLEMHNRPSPGAEEIWVRFPPYRREWTELKVQVYAAQMEVQPEVSRTWEISPDGIADRLEYGLIPREPGQKKIIVNIYHGGRFVGKMDKEIEVIAS